MIDQLQTVVIAASAVLAAALLVAILGPRYFPTAYWLAIGYPIRAVRVPLRWEEVAEGCKLTATTKRLGRSVKRVPGLGLLRPNKFGFKVWVRLIPGQTPDDVKAITLKLAHSWRLQSVKIEKTRPGGVLLSAIVSDPLSVVDPPEVPRKLLQGVVGRIETGAPWIIDFRVVPHWLIVGATQSGKSTLLNALISDLAPQELAMVGFDLKGGVELTPYQDRMSKIATKRSECLTLMEDLLAIVEDRMATCRAAGVANIFDLDVVRRPRPIVVFVDEVAELFLAGSAEDKKEVESTAVAILRIAQLGRAFGVFLVVAGQRVGSDIGPGVTALRAQLSGRICHRVNDVETAKMTLGDISADALIAAQQIAADEPGIAIAATSSGGWHRARSRQTTTAQAKATAQQYAHLATPWAELTRRNTTVDA